MQMFARAIHSGSFSRLGKDSQFPEPRRRFLAELRLACILIGFDSRSLTRPGKISDYLIQGSYITISRFYHQGKYALNCPQTLNYGAPAA